MLPSFLLLSVENRFGFAGSQTGRTFAVKEKKKTFIIATVGKVAVLRLNECSEFHQPGWIFRIRFLKPGSCGSSTPSGGGSAQDTGEAGRGGGGGGGVALIVHSR